MKVIAIHQHGGPDVLTIEDRPVPALRDNDVLIRLKATSLNRMDLWVRKGLPGMAPLPLILGCDGAGVVEAWGADVTGLSQGQRVFIFPMTTCGRCLPCLSGSVNLCRHFKIFGEHRDGTHCELMAVPAENVMRLDDNLSFAEGAAFPLVFMTAWHMLVANGGLTPGMDVLIIAGASGVGSAAIQIVKLFGARAIVTVGGKDKVALAEALGADVVIDHYTENISQRVKDVTGNQGVPLIFEHVGVKVWEACLKSLAWGGRLVTCGATSGPLVNLDLRHVFIKQQQIIGSTMGTRAEALMIHDFLSQGRLKAVVGKTFSYTDVRKAHEFLESSDSFGKVILDWN